MNLSSTMIRHLMASVAAAVLALVAIVLAGWSPRVEYILALAVFAAVVTVAVRQLGETTIEARWPTSLPPERIAMGGDPRVSSLENLLRRSTEDLATFERRLRPQLEALAAHRLRRGHGVELTAQPDLARGLLGDEAWAVLTEVPTAQVSPARLERTIAAIEHV